MLTAPSSSFIYSFDILHSCYSESVDKTSHHITNMSITTPITQLLGIQHPILLAGMGQTSGAPLAAAVSNAGAKMVHNPNL